MHPRGIARLFSGLARRRLVVAAAAVAVVAGALPVLTGTFPGTRTNATAAASTSMTTASMDTMRDGWDQNEGAAYHMDPASVPSFVERWRMNVAGQVFAEPLVIGNTVVVATENDWVYGLNRSTGAQLWATHLGNAFVITKASDTALRTCGDLTPNVGITGTPAEDTNTADATYGDVFFFAKVMSGTPPQPHYYLYGIKPSNGSVVMKVPVSGHPTNATKLTFNAQTQQERPGVLIVGGAVYGAFASHCDRKPYSGYVARVSLSARKASLWTDESGTTYNRGGIWQSGGGLVADPSNPQSIFLTTGNGVSPATRAGSNPGGQLAESVIRLAVTSTGTLSAKDFFSPSNSASLDAADTDFGSGGPIGLPYGTSSHPALLAQAGKDGRIFVLDRAKLGGHDQRNGQDASLYKTQNYDGVWGHPAAFGDTPTLDGTNNGTSNDLLFEVGKSGPLRIFRAAADSSGTPSLADVANTSLAFDHTSGSPVITSSGNDPSSAVLWEVYASSKTGVGSQLLAYSLSQVTSTSGAPSTCTAASQCVLTPIWSSGPNAGSTFNAAKYTIPATSAGWVYLGIHGTGVTGQVIAYSYPNQAAPVKAATATFAPTGVSGTSTKPVSLTATQPVTLTGVKAATGAVNALSQASAFTVGQVTEQKQGGATATPVTFPVTLAKGDKVTAAVRFAPAAAGTNTGTLAFTTTTPGTFRTLTVPLTGEGTKPGLVASPGALAFQWQPDAGVIDIPVGISVPMQVNITNYGTSTETVTSVTPPAGPFSSTDLPGAGQVIKPGDTMSVTVTFSPGQAGPASSSLSVNTTGGSVTVPLQGTGVAAVSKLTASPVHFGTIPVGKQATAYVTIANNGNTATTIQQGPRVPGPFAAPLKPDAGLPFNPEYDLAIPVTFTPAKKGTFTSRYTLIYTDVNGTHTLTVTLTGTAV